MAEATWQLIDRLTRPGGETRRTGIEAEVSALFTEFRVPLLRYLSSLGLSMADGEDVVQEVFLSLFRHLQAQKPRDHLRGWIFRVAHNLALKRRMQNGRAEAMAAGDPSENALADPAPNPEEQTVMEGANRRVLSVVNGLPERDRNCLFLRAEGLRYREIAEALEMSLGAVAASLSRSLGKLASAYQR
ncbi:MAG: RNA polymerase sigma factor [Acidobacteriota bacterium]